MARRKGSPSCRTFEGVIEVACFVLVGALVLPGLAAMAAMAAMS
ncbi:hypothetical protein ABZ805_29245 [Saccharopolyspora sp. NPDC047091]